jgi:hypothetical protein
MTVKTHELDINPETRVGALLDTYPELEKELFELSPAFKKLKNPVLRKTVAKVTSLRQAARVGDVSLAKLINTLRAAAGLTVTAAEEEEETTVGPAPEWFQQRAVKKKLDARPLIESGERPMESVLAAVDQLADGDVFELTTPFVPAPLIDMAKRKGVQVWYQEEATEVVKTYFGKPPRKGFEV